MDARYMLEGIDNSGKKCQIFISYLKMYTDSEILQDYLQSDNFVGEGHPKKDGVIIKIFDINEE